MVQYADAVIDGVDAAPPRELALYWQIRAYGSLPHAGGLLDQPAGLMARISTAGNVYTHYTAWYLAPSRNEWIAHNPQGWQVVKEAWKYKHGKYT